VTTRNWQPQNGSCLDDAAARGDVAEDVERLVQAEGVAVLR